MEFHSYPRLVWETRLLHEKLKARLAASGFDAGKLSDVDFSREFACKSGDIISYIYRKSNLVPSMDFKTFDRLIMQADKHPEEQKNRALVILDDYPLEHTTGITADIINYDMDRKTSVKIKRSDCAGSAGGQKDSA